MEGIMLTKIFFVRHAEPVHSFKDDRTRPLSPEGAADIRAVAEKLKDKAIDVFYCSPYKRSLDTISGAAAFYGAAIRTDERLREREVGEGHNDKDIIKKRWSDFDFHEQGGESLNSLQRRNVEALKDILNDNPGKNIVIGTHGSALSSILNYFDPDFGYEDFMRIVGWMPFIIELDFDGTKFVKAHEIFHREKNYL